MTSIADKKKINKADYEFKKREGEKLLKRPGDIDGLAFRMMDLKDCTVNLFDHIAQITIDRCENTTFIIGPVKQSVFFRDCKNCTIHVACSQFRCRDLYDSTVYLYVANEPVIEDAKNVTFAPYNVAYPLLDQHCASVGFEIAVNKWAMVFDFTENEDGTKNCSQMDPSQFSIVTKDIEGISSKPTLVFPYPAKYGGTLDDNLVFESKDESMKTFDIKSSSQAEVEQYMAQQESVPITTSLPQAQPVENNDMNAFMAGPSMEAQAVSADAFQTGAPSDNFGQPMGGFMQMQEQVPPQMNQSDPFAASGFSALPPIGMDGEDFTPEEIAHIQKVHADQEARKQKQYQAEVAEQQSKDEKRRKAREALDKFHAEKKQQQLQRRQNNHQEEAAYKEETQRQKNGANPWERVVSNVDTNSNTYPGTKDVSRIRSAMIARKADIAKGRTKKSGMF